MLFLSSTTDKIELVSSSTADLDYITSYAIGDKTTSPMVIKDADEKSGAITTATTTDISGSPAAANDRWNIRGIEVRNKHASALNTVIIRHVKAAGTARELIKVTLFAGWKLSRNGEGTWFVYDDRGGVIMGAAAASDTVAGLIQVALQSDMEAAASTTLAVTPGRQHFHPSAAKFWAKVVGAGTSINASYGVSSITDTGAGRLGVNLTANFSSTNYAVQGTVERASTALTVANIRDCGIRNASPVAGSFEIECWDDTATTHLQVDPTSYFVVGYGDL